MEQLQAKIKELKAQMAKQEEAVKEALANKERNNNLLTAFRHEKAELLAKVKEQQAKGETLTADQYVEARNSSTGLKARIEYHEAFVFDLEKVVETEKARLQDLQKQAIITRSKIVQQQAEQKLQVFFKENKEELEEIFNLFCLTGNYGGYSPLGEYTATEDAVKKHIGKCLGDTLPKEFFTPEEYIIHSPYLSEFKAKTPTQQHKEKFLQGKYQGIEALINELTNDN